MCKVNLQAGSPTAVLRWAATELLWELSPNVGGRQTCKGEIILKLCPVDATLHSSDGQVSFCSKTAIAWRSF